MCGIIGYNGTSGAVPFLIDGLRRLEYRGYDSAGIAVINNGHIIQEKKKGRIAVLSSAVKKRDDMGGTIGIGHTRWATHGSPTDENAHPHRSGKFTLVHNGIIENHKELKDKYLKLFEFKSETDTETAVHLINRHYSGNCLEAIAQTVKLLEGSFAFAILCEDEPDTIFCVRKASPLLIGIGEEASIASDISAVSSKANTLYRMADGEIAAVKNGCAEFYDFSLNRISKEPAEFSSGYTHSEKGKFEHYMHKEIYEQPEAVKRTVSSYLQNGILNLPVEIDKPERIYIVACGSAYHAGLAGRLCFEQLLGIPVSVEVASEFRYCSPLVNEKTPVIIISQSGETADSLAALREAKKRGAATVGIVNVPESSIATESDSVIYTKAGTEIAVATTKAYSAQLAALYMLAVFFAEKWHTAEKKQLSDLIEALGKLNICIENALGCEEQIREIAAEFANTEHAYFIGRGSGYAAAAEASLKLKEISYVHSEAYAAGEMKHGTISLIEPGTKVIAICAPNGLNAKMQSNIDEVKARGAEVFAVTCTHKTKADVCIHTVDAPHPMMSISTQIVPLQLLSYYVAKLRGCDIDKPRNLAKSVTVE